MPDGHRRVVKEIDERVVLDTDGVIDVIEEVPHDPDFRGHDGRFGVLSGRYGGGGPVARRGVLRLAVVHEDVAFDVGIQIQVEGLVGTAEEDVVEHLQHRAVAGTAVEVYRVVVAVGLAEDVSIQNQIPVGGYAGGALKRFAGGDLGNHRITDFHRRLGQLDNPAVHVPPDDVVDRQFRVLNVDAVAARDAVGHVGVGEPVVLHGVIKLEPGPLLRAARGGRKADAVVRRALGHEPPGARDADTHAGIEKDVGAGSDGQGGAVGNDDVSGHAQVAGRAVPNGFAGGERLAGDRGRRVAGDGERIEHGPVVGRDVADRQHVADDVDLGEPELRGRRGGGREPGGQMRVGRDVAAGRRAAAGACDHLHDADSLGIVVVGVLDESGLPAGVPGERIASLIGMRMGEQHQIGPRRVERGDQVLIVGAAGQ